MASGAVVTTNPVLALRARLLAAKAKIMENVFGPNAESEMPAAAARRRTTRRSSSIRRSESEKHRAAAARAASAAAKALASGKTRKQLRGNAKFLANAGVLPNRLRIGAPLAKVEGTGYHRPTIALRRRTSKV
jgi:hypothetical protein